MSGYTKDELQTLFDAAKKAYLEALKGMSVNANGRGKTRQSIAALKADMDHWREQLDAANGDGINITTVVSKHV